MRVARYRGYVGCVTEIYENEKTVAVTGLDSNGLYDTNLKRRAHGKMHEILKLDIVVAKLAPRGRGLALWPKQEENIQKWPGIARARDAQNGHITTWVFRWVDV